MAIALELPGSIKSLNPVPVDWSYGPFATVAAAKAAIPSGLRYDGLTVQVTGSGNYWWLQSDLTDTGLTSKGIGSLTLSTDELPKSSGGTLVHSGIFSTSTGNLDLGFGLIGTIRNIRATGTATDVDLQFNSKGLGALTLVGNSVVIGASTYGTAIGNITIQGNQSSLVDTAGGSVKIFSGQGNNGNASSGNIFIDTLSKTGSGIIGSISIFKQSADYGGGEKVVFFGRATTIPITNPTGGGLMFVKTDDKPYWRDSAGVETSMLAGGSGWPLTGTGTFSGAVLIDETTTGGNTLKFKSAGLGITSIDGKGIWLYNDTVAANSAQQISGSIVQDGQGWATTPVQSRSVKVRNYLLPVQGAANPAWSWIFQSSINNAAYTTELTFDASYFNIINANLSVGQIWGKANIVLQFSTQQTTSTAGGFLFTNTNLNYISTSGIVNEISVSGSTFSPTSGTAVFNELLLSNTVNQTGGANGQITWINSKPTITAAVNVTGYDWNPVTPANITGTHYAYRSTAGLLSFTQNVYTSGSPTHFTLIGAAHTSLATTVEASSINLDYSQTIQFATGTLALQRFGRLQIGTVGFVGASTLTRAVGLSISGPVKAGTNATISTSIGLEVESRNVSGGSGVTNAYGAIFNAPSGASNNWSLGLSGNIGISGSVYIGASLSTVPNHSLEINGSLGLQVITPNPGGTGTSPNSADCVILADASGGTYTVTLPTGATVFRRIYIVKKIDSSVNSVIISATNIDGATTKTINTQYSGYMLINKDGTDKWSVIGAF